MNEIQAIDSLFDANKVLMLLAAFALLWGTVHFVQIAFNKVADYLPSKRFTILQVNTLSSFLLYIGGTIALFVLIIDPPKEIVLATAGSLAVAIGFALKDIAASIVAGVVLIFDTPFKTGDRVQFADTYGEIIAIGLRSVKLRTLDDNIVTIPNARFINETVASANYGALDMMVVCTFHISLQNDIEKVKDIIREVIVTSRFGYLKKDINFTVNECVLHDKLALQINAKSYVMDVRYEKAFQSDVISTTNKLFLDNSIQRP